MKQLKKAQWLLDDVRKAIKALEKFQDKVKEEWSKLSKHAFISKVAQTLLSLVMCYNAS